MTDPDTSHLTSAPVNHLGEVQIILDSLRDYQHDHAALLTDHPDIDAYWHAGQQIVSAAMMLQSALDMIRQGKAYEHGA